MKAQRLLSEAVLGPEAIAAVRKAFDEAWAEMAPRFGDDAEMVEQTRLRLAHAVLAVADEGSRNAETVKAQALAVMELTAPKVLNPEIS